MANTYEVSIVGAGGGFLAGQVAPCGSWLILDAGPWVAGATNHGTGLLSLRTLATQINRGTRIADSKASNHGSVFFTCPMYTDESSPTFATGQHEARLVGGGSAINVEAWLRPRAVGGGFNEATGVTEWPKANFELSTARTQIPTAVVAVATVAPNAINITNGKATGGTFVQSDGWNHCSRERAKMVFFVNYPHQIEGGGRKRHHPSGYRSE